MKKLLALLLALVMCLSLCACGDDAPEPTSTTSPATEPATTAAPTVAETEPPVVSQALDLKGLNVLGEIGELTVVSGFSCDILEPPMTSGVHVTYSPSNGNIYVVLSCKFTNNTASRANVSDLITVAIVPEGSDNYFGASYFAITEGGSGLESYPAIDPLATLDLYLAFSVPIGTETDDYTLVINDKDGGIYTGMFSVSLFESSRPELKIGDTISAETIELTIDDVYFADSLYPPKMSGYYHYYEAESGKIYLIVKVTAMNLKSNDMKYDSIAGVSCVYKEKYNYSSFCALEEDGGADLNGYPSQYAIAPLDTGTCYYLMEVPAAVQEGPVVITVFAAGQYYSIVV